MPNFVSLKLCDELYGILVKENQKTGVPMNEIAVKILAAHYERPDLGYVPRLPQGRRPYKNANGKRKQPA